MEKELAGLENAVSVDVQGEAVITQEGRYRALRLNSTDQLVDENDRGKNSNYLCKILNSRVVVISVFVVLIVVIIVLAVLLSGKQEHKEQSYGPEASRSYLNADDGKQEHKEQSSGPEASRSYLNADDGIDWCILSESSSCVAPSCIACKEDIVTPLESTDCSTTDAPEMNGSCVSCGEKCLTLQDLLNMTKQNETHLMCPNKNPLELKCCVLSAIGSRTQYCGDEGRYLCYKQSAYEPICTCPPGSQSNHCNKQYYTQLGDCKCFNTSGKFCGQEQITRCDKVKTDWTTCRMERSEQVVHYNCLCQKSTGNDAHSVRCPRPKSGTNGTNAFG